MKKIYNNRLLTFAKSILSSANIIELNNNLSRDYYTQFYEDVDNVKHTFYVPMSMYPICFNQGYWNQEINVISYKIF